MSKLPDITARKIIASSKLFRIEEIDLTFSNGEQRIFERIRSHHIDRGTVMVVPITADQQIILAREYAVGTERYELSLPKGIIEVGESPEAAAQRELQEEIGIGARSLHYLGSLDTAPHYLMAKMSVILASDLYPASLPGDEPEPITTLYASILDISALITTGYMTEARAIAALFLAREWLIKHAQP